MAHAQVCDGFAADFAPYRQGKGSVQFPLAEPLPVDLIARVIEHRVGHGFRNGTSSEEVDLRGLVGPEAPAKIFGCGHRAS